MKLPIRSLATPVRAWNVDGTLNQSGTIKQKTSVVLNYGGIREQRELMVLDCGKDEVILGLLWFRAVNPDIDWKEGQVTIIPASYGWTTGQPPTITEQRYLLWYLEHDEQEYVQDWLYESFCHWTPNQRMGFMAAHGDMPEFIVK